MPKVFSDWLAEVDPILTLVERALFLSLKQDYQRDAFIRRFWQVRDPYPRTGRNEFRERFDERVQLARSQFGTLSDDRARILLVHGRPIRIVEVKCTTKRKPAEIWLYAGSDQVEFRFLLVFLRGSGGLGPGRLWRPSRGGSLENMLSRVRGCINGYALRDVASQVRNMGAEYDLTLDRVLAKPRPKSVEWVSTFASYSTDLPPEAPTFDASSSISFIGRHQQRTVVQGLVKMPVDEVVLGDFGGYRSYNFTLTGEVILNERLFESFRYKYGFPLAEFADRPEIVVAFQRFLRPGDYSLILKVEDLNGESFYRQELSLAVPKLANVLAPQPSTDPETERLFSEATAAAASDADAIRIVPPARDLQTGFVRIDTIATGADIKKVAFFVDDRQILTKNRPPFNVELDLGPFPRVHRLRVDALAEDDTVVATDEALLNAGGHRFSIRLVEPRRGGQYDSSLRARAEIQVPDGRALERLEFFLNETLVATLYQSPWVQPIQLPRAKSVSYIRAVAHLVDGNTTEDLVFINSPELLEQVDVQFVELFTAVVDRNGRPISGLASSDFEVEEDGVRQSVVRFDLVQDLPIHVGVLIDNSASMHRALGDTRDAALRFFSQAITPRDRAAVITFNRFPRVAVKLTNDLTQLGGGLAGLTAEGQTALYDSMMFALYYFTGVTGQRAILLLSDGKDEVSRFSFEEALEYARRAGVTVYTIGLGIPDGGARQKLATMAEETGGASYFIQDVAELEAIYTAIQQELRSQYLIAYQSSNTKQDDKFRSIEVKVGRPGAVVKTMSGYYP